MRISTFVYLVIALFLGLFIYGGIVLAILYILSIPAVLAILESYSYQSIVPYMNIWGNLGTGVAAIFAIIASWLLRKTYTLQKDELSSMRSLAQQQTAWDSILQLCKLYMDILAQTKIADSHAQGREGLKQLIERITKEAKLPENTENTTSEEIANIINHAADQFNSHEMCFRLLHRMFKYIDEMDISPEEKQDYARIPRAILSNVELEALLINCLTSRGKGMKQYIEKFHILNNYSHEHTVVLDKMHAEALMKEYEETAFKVMR